MVSEPPRLYKEGCAGRPADPNGFHRRVRPFSRSETTSIDAAAARYLLKDAPPSQVFQAVRNTAKGEAVLAPAVAATLVRRATSTRPLVTDREAAILELLADGLGNKDITRQLLVSEATIKSHLSHIYTKLDVDSRAGAVAKAIEQRIIRT